MSKRKNICYITNVPESFHALRVASGIFTQCEKYDYNVAVFAAMISPEFYFKDYAEGEKNIYELLNYEKFDGIILDNIRLVYANRTDLIETIYHRIKEKAKCPVFGIGIPFEDIPMIENKNDEMLRELCRHAIETHGCRKICILTGMKGNHESEERLSVMIDEIEKHGLTVEDEHKIYGDFWYGSGTKLAEDIVSGKISKPDAVIAASDHMALGLIEKLTALGKNVPDYLRVLGFEATDEAALGSIPLTTIESNFAKCGADAVDRIRALIEPDKTVIPYEAETKKMLRLGRSCGCPADTSRALESLKTSLYFRARHHTAEIYRDNIDIGLLMENYIPEQLASSENPEVCIEKINGSTFIISPFVNFYLCLREDWLDSEADITVGYPDKMQLVLVKSNIGEHSFCDDKNKITFDTSEMLPQMFADRDEPYAFYFSAVHFGDKALGYAVLQRKLKDSGKFNLVYRNWLRFVNTALEMSRSKNKLAVLSAHDKMTGRLNRRGMFDEYEKMLKQASPDDMVFACVIDMDGLKYINDTFGHQEGDSGIVAVSDCAAAITDGNEICVRSGGDEFYIIGIGKYDDHVCEDKTERFKALLAGRSEAAHKPYTVTASIGCAYRKLSETEKLNDVLIEADKIMYNDKITRKMHRQ